MLLRNKTTRNAQSQNLHATLRHIQKLIRKLPESQPFKDTFLKLMAGEQVLVDDVTPFLDALSMDRRSRNICLLSAWALGQMEMSDEDKKLASNALVQLAEKELVPTSKGLKTRRFGYFASHLVSLTLFAWIILNYHQPILPAPPANLPSSAVPAFFKHREAILDRNTLHEAILMMIFNVAMVLLVPVDIVVSGIGFCNQLLFQAQISLFAIDQPESTSLRIQWLSKTKSNFRMVLKSRRLNKSWAELVTNTLNAISSENRGQLGLQAMERMSSLLLKVDYVNLGVADAPVALSILQALYRAGDSRAIPAVKTVLKRTKDPGLRLAAQQTLEVLEEQRTGDENLLHVTDGHSADTLLRAGSVDTTTHVDLLRPSISTTEDVVHNTPTVIPTASRDEATIELSNRAV